MPILVQTEELEPGMILDDNVINRYSVMLKRGHTLSDKDIAALKRLQLQNSYAIADPILNQVVEFQDQTADKNISRKIRSNVTNLVQKVSDNIRSNIALDADNIAGIENTIRDMLDYLKNNPVTMALLEQSRQWDNYLQEHCANVFYLSIVIGNTIRNYIKNERHRLSAADKISNALNITPLATAAIFHDLGMVPIEYVYTKKDPLTPQEIQQIREHPTIGAEMLPDEINPMVKLIVKTHHENQTGSGYPQGLPGQKINIFSRIIRVADSYAAATATQTYKRAKLPVQVLYEMLRTPISKCYDPVILKVLASIVPPLPIGAKLKLLNGKWAVVVRYNRENCFQPYIITAYDEFGDPLPPDKITKPTPICSSQDTMVKSFGSQDLTFMNNLPAEHPVDPSDFNLDFKLNQEPTELFELAFP